MPGAIFCRLEKSPRQRHIGFEIVISLGLNKLAVGKDLDFGFMPYLVDELVLGEMAL